MKAWIDPQDIAYSQYLCRLLFNTEKTYKSLAKPLENARIFSIPEIRGEYAKHVDQAKKHYEAMKKQVQEQAMEYATKYWHAAYAYATILRNISLVFTAYPPQVTTTRQLAVKPSAYINTLFIPVVRSDGRPIQTMFAKLLYKHYTLIMRYKRKYIEKQHPRLKIFIEQKKQQYMGKGYPEARARKLAYRDALRVIIGNIWLVGIYYLVKEGAIQPEEIILPYELAQNPELHKDRINPAETVIEYRLPPELQHEIGDITWTWLIKTTKR
ncbi:MAG: hypothetical protein GXO43_05960 [Crenarchaeota archaeon]|nr:hypothetical protein [Thermoproteota archaeon]